MPSPQSSQNFQNPATVVEPATATDLSLTAAGSAPSDETKGACALPNETEGAGRQGEMQNTSVSSGRPSPKTSPSGSPRSSKTSGRKKLVVGARPFVPPHLSCCHLSQHDAQHGVPTDAELSEADAEVVRHRQALATAQRRAAELHRHRAQGSARVSGAHTGGISKVQVRALERAGEPPKCGYCHKAGHWNHNGPTGAKAGGCPDKYPCSICNASDHCGRQHRRQACSKPPVSEGFATPVSRPSSSSASSPPPSPRMQVDPAEVSPATGSVEQGEHSDPLGVRAEERVPSQLCARAAEVVKACRDDLRKLEQEQLATSAGNVQGDEQSAQQGERSAAEVHLQADVPTEAAKNSAPDLSAERGADQDQSGRPEADRQERSLQQEESLLGSEKGVRPALPDGAALHGARPKGWIDKFPAYAELKRNREAQDARDGKPRHQAR